MQINSCHFRRGGADAVYLNTGAMLERHGHEVHYFSMKYDQNLPVADAPFFAENNDFRGASLGKKLSGVRSFVYNKDAYRKISDLIDKTRPDVAHLHLYLGKLSGSILKALQQKNVPVVATVHDYRLLCPAYLFLDAERKICEKCRNGFYMNCTLKRCSDGNLVQSAMLSADAYFRKYRLDPVNYIRHFIFVSDFIRRKHIEYDARYSPKATLLYNFIPDLPSIPANHEKGKYFLYYGRLSREKGIRTLVRAAAETGLPLKIVGTGPEFSGNEEIATNIEFLGYKTGAELWDIVSSAGFVILPSEWYENNPLSVIESFAYGKPVIGSSIGGIPEIIRHGDTGFLFEAANLAQLKDSLLLANELNGEDYGRMSRACRAFAENHFQEGKHYSELISIYEDLLKTNKN